MKNWRIVLALSLLTIDAGAFFLVVAFLPRSNGFTYSSSYEYFVNSYQRWDIAKMVFIASLLVSVGVYGLVEARVLAKASR